VGAHGDNGRSDVAGAGSAVASSVVLNVSVVRYGGADRYVTSLQVAEAVAADAGGSLEWVVLVSGRRWTDAVVAAPVAGALGAPVLMTPPDELRADALEFLRRVGVSKAMVVGPDASGGAHGPGRGVAAEVLEALDEAGISAERVAGDDRYGTGVAAAGRVTPGAMGDLGATAVIASGEVFADALVAGPFAARGIHPVLLSPPNELHAEVAGYLGDAGIAHVVLMGGTAALSAAVEQAVKDLGIDVSRVAGSTRYDTAVKAAELAEDKYSAAAGKPCFANDTIGLARARVPFDSFSAAPLLGRLCAPLVLADPGKIPADTAAYLDAARETHDAVGLRVFGGDAAVSQAAIDAYLTGAEADTGEDEAGDDRAEGGADGTDDDGESSTPLGVLPPGTCGGAIDDEPALLVDNANAEDPAWSPDCSRLVYTQNGSLWTVNNDGTDARKLVNHDGGYLYLPVWSPDGTRIAYSRGHNDGNGNWTAHIWTVNVDGSHNNQRTEGDVIDRWATWSPDGKWLAFERETGSGRNEQGHRLDSDRHIVVMTSFGNKPKALNEGGHWEQSPAWSPDGSQLAYQTNGFLVVADTDGGNERRVHAAVYFAGGLSWSPDGTRVAFTRGDGTRSSIVIADIDGAEEEVVYDESLKALAPRWSPDGQRLAFHTIDDDGKHRSYVAGASGELAGIADDCRPRGVGGVTAGFPLPHWSPSAVGTVRIGVLFMDFPDAQAAHTTAEEAALGLPWAEEYLEAASYDKLDVEFVPLHRWLRAEQEFAEYIGPTAIGEGLVNGASAHAVALADDEVDFSTLDMVLTVFPGSHFSGGNALGDATADGVTITTTRVHTNELEEPREPAEWGYVGAHEIAHNLGLLDMYPYDFERHTLPELTGDAVWAFVDMGLMGLRAQFQTQSSDQRLQHVWRFPDGGTTLGTSASFKLGEMLGWSRWQLGWLDPSQVHCDSGAGATVTLAPIAEAGSGVALAVVPLTAHEVIVIESRRAVGHDLGREWVDSNSNARTTFPGLVSEGVLVYTVDSFIGSGDLPVKVAGDSGNSEVDDFPVLGAGESVTLHGYTITVTADNGSTHTVSITRNS
jgi:M6 family metalloprotease-like protein